MSKQRSSSRSPGAIRAVVLTGKPPAFSAGADLNGVEEGQFATDLAAVLRGFTHLPVPVIAAIDGPALGAGAQLAIATDLRVATPTSVLGIPAAKLGLVVDHWTIRRLASEFSPPIARSMLIAAQTYTAQQLHATGGIHRLGGLDDAVAWAHELSQLAPLTIAGHKLGLERSSGRTRPRRSLRSCPIRSVGERRRGGGAYRLPRQTTAELHRLLT